MLNDLEKLWAEEATKAKLPAPTGTREEIAVELLRRIDEREERLKKHALEATREGDDDGVWMAMAARAEDRRFRERILRDMPHLRKPYVQRCDVCEHFRTGIIGAWCHLTNCATTAETTAEAAHCNRRFKGKNTL